MKSQPLKELKTFKACKAFKAFRKNLNYSTLNYKDKSLSIKNKTQRIFHGNFMEIQKIQENFIKFLKLPKLLKSQNPRNNLSDQHEQTSTCCDQKRSTNNIKLLCSFAAMATTPKKL